MGRCCEGREILFMCQEISRKKFPPLWRCCKACGGLVKYQETSRNSFQHWGGAVKDVLACLNAGKVRDSSFNYRGDL